MPPDEAAPLPARQPGPIPVSVVTGFLGSGKTTLLNRLLADPGMAGSIVIVNEFGEVGLDHLLVARPREDVVLLSSGCLCCTVRGDLVETLRMLRDDRGRPDLPWFDRILIETTGLADPVPVLLTVLADPEMAADFRLNAVATTVDALHGEGQLAEHEACLRQVCVADHLLLTKTDLAPPATVAALEATLRSLNPGAVLRRALHGETDRALLEAIETGAVRPASADRWIAAAAAAAPPHAGIASFAFVLDEPVTRAGLEVWMNLLQTFRGPNLLRLKGLLDVEGTPMVLHAVQHLFHPLQPLDAWPSDDRRSRLVVIARDIGREEIARTLPALHFTAPPQGAGKLIDPAAYARFAALTGRFR